jgi:hypothetical protein
MGSNEQAISGGCDSLQLTLLENRILLKKTGDCLRRDHAREKNRSSNRRFGPQRLRRLLISHCGRPEIKTLVMRGSTEQKFQDGSMKHSRPLHPPEPIVENGSANEGRKDKCTDTERSVCE